MASRTTLDLLFRHALRTGKRARSETAIGRGTASISHAAVELAADRLGSLAGRRVLVVGAGDMGAGVATSLRKAGATDITVANRTPTAVAHSPPRSPAVVVAFDELDDALARQRRRGHLRRRHRRADHRRQRSPRRGGELLIVDIALPRNVDRAVAALAGVTVLDLDDVSAWAQRGRAARAGRSRPESASIIADQLERFLLDSTARQAAPLVARLHDHAEQIRSAEVQRFSARASANSPTSTATPSRR